MDGCLLESSVNDPTDCIILQPRGGLQRMKQFQLYRDNAAS
jgi:hypothetical protein